MSEKSVMYISLLGEKLLKKDLLFNGNGLFCFIDRILNKGSF